MANNSCGTPQQFCNATFSTDANSIPTYCDTYIQYEVKMYVGFLESMGIYQLLHQHHRISAAFVVFKENELASSPLLLHKANIL